MVDIASGLYSLPYEAEEWTGMRLDGVRYKISVELPWSMRTLDTMKLTIMIETTMGLS